MVYTPYIWPMFAAAFFCVLVALYVRRFPDIHAVKPFSAMMWLGAMWAVIYALNILVVDLPLRIFLSTCIYLPTRLLSPSIFWLVLEYSGREKWITRRNTVLILILPVIAIIASLTSPWHQLFRYNFELETVGSLAVLHFKGGIIYTLSTIYGNGLIVLSLILLIPSFRSRSLHLKNTALIFAGLFIPALVNILFAAGGSPIRGYNFAPTTIVVTAAAYMWALLRFRLFGVAPIARSTVMENIADPVVVLDTNDQIVDFNAAAQAAFGFDPKRSIGSKIKSLDPEKSDFFLRGAGRPYVNEDTRLSVGGRLRDYDLNISPIFDARGRTIGRLFLLHDIQELKEAEATVTRLLNEKELLLKEVHHRIKNNMSTMASILSLQADTVTEASAKAALQDAPSRIHSMMVLYGKLYLSPEGGSIDVESYLSPLIDRIVRSFDNASNIRVVKSFDAFELDAKMLFSLGIIINELMTNAMKHAFVDRPSGTLSFSALVENGDAVISVADDGVGIPEDIGIDNTEGFGLSLVKLLAKQLGGSIALERTQGARFVFRFALPACRSHK